jgi:uncharacterized protein (TIGR01777 family)
MPHVQPKVVIAGGSGFLGRLLAGFLIERGWDVVTLVRGEGRGVVGRAVRWDGRTVGAWRSELEGAAAAINLAGRSINTRYTAANRKEILASRIESTTAFGNAIAAAAAPPAVWINASGTSIYANLGAGACDEATVVPVGDGNFLREVAREWEWAQAAVVTPHTRQVAARIAPVLGHARDSMFPTLRRLVRMRLGGTVGPGDQWVSWIHQHDLARAMGWIIERGELSGPVNLCAPEPVTNREFMATFRRVMKIRIGLPAPVIAVRIGTWVTRQEPALVLDSVRAVPEKLAGSGFRFEFGELGAGLGDLLDRRATGEQDRVIKS